MTRTDELLAFYRAHRIEDQTGFYAGRRALFDRASGQAAALSATLLGFATAAGALSGAAIAPVGLWSVLATVLPAAVTAVTGYATLYAFEQQSKLYADALRAVQAAARDGDGATTPEEAAELVRSVESALRQEQNQWGQLTAEIVIADESRTPPP